MGLHHWFYKLPLRLRSLFLRRRVEQELDDELQFHIERQIQVFIAEGRPASYITARRAARVDPMIALRHE